MIELLNAYPERFEFCYRCKYLHNFLGVYNNNLGHGKYAMIMCSQLTALTRIPKMPPARTTCKGFEIREHYETMGK